MKAGATVHGVTDVEGFVINADGFLITTSRGTTEARDLLICTNGYTGKTTP